MTPALLRIAIPTGRNALLLAVSLLQLTLVEKAQAVARLPGPTGSSPMVIRVGYLPATHHVLLFIAKELHLFDQRVIDVKLVPYDNSVQMLNALKSDELDIGMPGIATPAAEIGARAPLSIIGGAAARSAALVASRRLADQLRPLSKEARLRKLATERIGAVTGSTGLAVLKQALAGLRPPVSADIREYTRPSDVVSAVASGEVALGLLWSPHMTVAESKGLQIVSWMSEYLEDHVCCRQIARDAFLMNHAAIVEYLVGTLKAWRRLQSAQHDVRAQQQVLLSVKPYLKSLSDADLMKELFGPSPRTTLSPSLDRHGIDHYLDAMLKSGLMRPDQCQFVRTKINATFMLDALKRMGCSDGTALHCVDEPASACECLQ